MRRLLMLAVICLAVLPGAAPRLEAKVRDSFPREAIVSHRTPRSPTIIYFDDMESGDGGWTHVDRTASGTPEFRIDDEVAYAGGHSWWCGEENGAFSGGSGYGNNWDQILSLPELDVSGATYPTLDFVYSSDSEAGYDYTYVQAESSGAYVNLIAPVDGVHAWTSRSVPLGPEFCDDHLRVRFRFRSDIGYSDEDGKYDSGRGAFHVDDIRVYDALDGSLIFLDDAERGGLCEASVPPPAGDWWHRVSRRCPAYSGTRSWWAGDDADTSHVPPLLKDALISPAVSMVGASVCTLRFLLHAEVPTVGNDLWTEEVTTDGGATWHMVGAWWGDFGQCSGWATHGIQGIDLTPFLPGNEFRFRLTICTDDNGCGPGVAGGAGIMLDDVWLEDWTGTAIQPQSWARIKSMYR
jgi:hypothetical protein